MSGKRDDAPTNFGDSDIAAQYDVYPRIHRALGKPALLNFIGDVTGKNVLDLGCGTGHITKNLQDAGGNCFGIDVSEKFIALAKQRYPEIDFRVASGCRLDFVPSSSLDLVVMSMVLLSISQRDELRELFSESARVLKPGGQCIVSTIHPLNMRPFADGIRQVELPADWSYFDSGRTYRISIELSDGSRMNIVNAHWTLEDVSSLLAQAGLVIDQIVEPQLDRQCEEHEALGDLLKTPYYIFFRTRKKQ